MSEGSYDDVSAGVEDARNAEVVSPIEITNPELLSRRIGEGYVGSIIVAEGNPWMTPDQVPVRLEVLPRNGRNVTGETVDLQADVRFGHYIGEEPTDREDILFAVVGTMHKDDTPLLPVQDGRYVVTGPTGEKIQIGLNQNADNRGAFGIMIKTGHQGHSPHTIHVIQTIATIVDGIDAARETAGKYTQGNRDIKYTVAIPEVAK